MKTKKKNQYTILEIFTKKNSLRNLTRFHGGLFQFEILETFAIAFLLKTVIWTYFFVQVLPSALLKNETKNLLEKDASQLKIAWQLT